MARTEGAVPAGASASAGTIALLKRHASFASIGEAHLRRIVEESRVETLAEGAVAFAQGESGDFAYLVLSGELSVEVENEHGRVRVAVMRPGDLVGEIAAFATMPRTATVAAIAEARLLRLDQSVICGLLSTEPAATMAIIGELGRRLQNLNGTIATLVQAATALAVGDGQPAMLETLKAEASRLSLFAGVFEQMAEEIAEKRRLSQEMHTAVEIQRSLLPRGIDLGTHTGAGEVFATMIPAKEIGGDFYDYFIVGPRHLAFAIGDVSGKGVPAAMFMSLTRTVLKTVASDGGAPAEVLGRVNRLLVAENAEAMFVTVFFGCLNLETGALAYSSAGHDEVFLLRADGTREQLPHLGPAIGLFGDAVYPGDSRRLEPGDMIVLATDGVTEAFNGAGEAFGFARLEAVLDRIGECSAEAAVAAVMRAVDAFADGAPRSDDTTCLAVAFRGRG